MPNTVYIHERGARSTSLACNGCITQATHNRYTVLAAHAEHRASTRTKTSARKVHYTVRTCRAPSTHIHTYSRRWVKGSGCTCRPPYITHKRTHVQRHHSGCTYRMPNRMHTRVKCGSQAPSSISSHRTIRLGKGHAAAQPRTLTTEPCAAHAEHRTVRTPAYNAVHKF